eukprot:1793003-Rhodomonas_salina.3
MGLPLRYDLRTRDGTDIAYDPTQSLRDVCSGRSRYVMSGTVDRDYYGVYAAIRSCSSVCFCAGSSSSSSSSSSPPPSPSPSSPSSSSHLHHHQHHHHHHHQVIIITKPSSHHHHIIIT